MKYNSDPFWWCIVYQNLLENGRDIARRLGLVYAIALYAWDLRHAWTLIKLLLITKFHTEVELLSFPLMYLGSMNVLQYLLQSALCPFSNDGEQEQSSNSVEAPERQQPGLLLNKKKQR